jgi:putative transposon-encoded protein
VAIAKSLYNCKTGLVRCAGKYIAKDDYTMYYENHVERSSKLKRRSTRHVSEVTAMASEFGNSAKIIVPRGWLGRRVIAFLHSEYISKHHEERKADE